MADSDYEEDMDTSPAPLLDLSGSPDNGRRDTTPSVYPSLGDLDLSSGIHSVTEPVVETQPQRVSNRLMRQTSYVEKGDQFMDNEKSRLPAPLLPTSGAEEDLYTAGVSQASAAPMKTTTSEVQGRTPAEETEGVVYALVDSQWKDDKSKPKQLLQKALQRWFNTNNDFKHTSCDVKSCSEDGRALIHIKPASVIESLLQLGGTEVTTKDGQKAKIWFRTQIPDPGTPTPDSHVMDVPSALPPATQDTETPMQGRSGGAATAEQETESFHLPLGGAATAKQETESFHLPLGGAAPAKQETESFHLPLGGVATAEQETESFQLPLGLFWYMNQAYKEEIKGIEGDNGVQIKAEVKVSFEVGQNAGVPNLTKAKGEFKDLVQSCLRVYDSRTSSLKDVDSGDWTATLKTLQREEAKVVLTASSEECTVWGPRESLAALPKSLTRPKYITKPKDAPGKANISPSAPESFTIPRDTPGNNDNLTKPKDTPGKANISPSTSAWGSSDSSQKIGLNIKDPLVSDGIILDEILWKLMTSSFNKKINNIEHKFGVKLEQEISQGKVKVRAKFRNGVEAAALKSHALRALLQLYQRVATSTMSCSLTAPGQAKEVEDKLKDIHPRYPVIGTGENFVSWRLIGLPENLGPAVNELEKLVGPVFKEEDKQRIGYSGYNMSSAGAAEKIVWSEENKQRIGYSGYNMSNAGAAEKIVGSEENKQRIGYSGYNMSNAGAAERIVGSVFKQEDKQRIGYSGYNMSNAGTASMGGGATAGGATEENSDEKCPICIDTFNNKRKLECGHEFCEECLNLSLASMGATCPVCKDVFGKMEGDQPHGRMSCKIAPYINIPGFDMCGAITITYDIPTGTQTEKHPNPGKTYYGIQRVAYLPDNEEGREVLQLLRRAFDQKLIFTVGTSRTTGAEDVVTWNDIHHKTNTHGGPISFGYPDPNYLSRVKDELKAKGIE